jgi:hypothetical protein
MARRPLVTLLTDFGTADGYVGAMKGVILRNAPSATVVDIAHDLPPQNVIAAAHAVAASLPMFPEGTIHVVVVDPGVGSDRNILAVRLGGQVVLAPDNGVLSVLTAQHTPERIVSLRNPRYVPASTASRTFHGRDIFAPVAAHLASGVAMDALGPAPDTVTVLDLPVPSVSHERIDGQVLYADRFGNLITNIPGALLTEPFPDLSVTRVWLGETLIGPVLPSYSFTDEGQSVALINSMGSLEIAVNQGNAADRFGEEFGMPVAVTLRR